MCGICGTIGFNETGPAEKMRQAMVYRGSDDSGIYQDSKTVLGHNRLSIIDLSLSGHQPMSNEDGTIWIVFNGEIYNFLELKEELTARGHIFRSGTDMETIIHLYEEQGVDCLKQLRGMFSFAIWDKRRKRLFVARDRFGIKPLFYYHKNSRFIFSSELKAILASGFVEKEIDASTLREYFISGSVSAPSTLIRGVRQLLPAHYLIFENAKLDIRRYWDLKACLEKADLQKREEEHISAIRSSLSDSVKIRLVSDVPLGIFLSGGIDSSAITALAQHHSSQPIKTFSIVFDETGYDEREFSRIAAKWFNTDHKEILVREKDILKQMPIIFDSMDQPSIDGFNTFIISKAVKDAGITVALSGLGGDELFAGYASFRALPRVYQALRLAKVLPKSLRAELFKLASPLAKTRHGLKFLFSLLGCDNLCDLYYLKRAVYLQHEVESLLPLANKGHYDRVENRVSKETDLINELSYLELTNYLQNTLLQDADRMSMANSLEVRVPFLDHLFVETALAIPGRFKVAGGHNKRLLVKAMADFLPEEVYNRSKMGFVFPFENWLKGPLKAYCQEQLSTSSIKKIPLLNAEEVDKIWRNFSNGSNLYNYSSILSLVSFTSWYTRNIA